MALKQVSFRQTLDHITGMMEKKTWGPILCFSVHVLLPLEGILKQIVV